MNQVSENAYNLAWICNQLKRIGIEHQEAYDIFDKYYYEFEKQKFFELYDRIQPYSIR